jgi:transposase
LRPDVQSRRRWWDILVRGRLDPQKFVFIDETAVTTHMTRRYGRSPRGARVVAHELLGAWKTHTLLAAIRPTGWSAAMVLKGSVDAQSFVAYVEQCLVPTLKRGEIVVLDNVSSHHDERVRPLIQKTGATLHYLPPYSPDFNPIENAFSQLKAGLRKLGETTFAHLTNAIGRLLDETPAKHCQNFFQACGYV